MHGSVKLPCNIAINNYIIMKTQNLLKLLTKCLIPREKYMDEAYYCAILEVDDHHRIFVIIRQTAII